MKKIIQAIRNECGISQEEMARELDTSFATVNRWENGHSAPNKMAQHRLYEFCSDSNIDLDSIICKKIDAQVAAVQIGGGRVPLYHGSKSGIKGAIAPISRSRCDFGRGFYMGTDPYQALTLISDFEHSKFYVMSIDLDGLRVLTVKPDLEWAMTVAYHRGKLENVRETSFYKQYAAKASKADVIVGSIADDRMFYVLDNFFLGNITDKALVMSLSALQLGEQYDAVSEKACRQVKIETEMELSYLERLCLNDRGEANRSEGINLARSVCKDYRREGLFFDEIIEKAR